jgi:hypothetical protein
MVALSPTRKSSPLAIGPIRNPSLTTIAALANFGPSGMIDVDGFCKRCQEPFLAKIVNLGLIGK